jgi:hypothetical protein
VKEGEGRNEGMKEVEGRGGRGGVKREVRKKEGRKVKE